MASFSSWREVARRFLAWVDRMSLGPRSPDSAGQLAADFGPHGVRVAWMLSPGPPGSDDQHHEASFGEQEAMPAPGTEGLLLSHQPSYEEVANIAAVAASDWARTITASELNITGGAVID
jgi:3-oxoacyl-[acyl-carrier protein] reductase